MTNDHPSMRLADLVATSRAVGESSGRLQKIAHLASLLGHASSDEIETVISFLSGSPRQGRIGIGGAAIREARAVPAAGESTLEVRDVDRAFDGIMAASGAGSNAARASRLRDLMGRATADEQDFLARLLFGELRQGALEGVLRRSGRARARTSRPPRSAARRCWPAPWRPVAARRARRRRARRSTRSSLSRFSPFSRCSPIPPTDVDEAMRALGEAALEYKLDGARIQVHKAGDDVRVYSRGICATSRRRCRRSSRPSRALPARELILDGEAIALRADGRRSRSR